MTPAEAALKVACPFCHSRADRGCVNVADGRPRQPHEARLKAADAPRRIEADRLRRAIADRVLVEYRAGVLFGAALDSLVAELAKMEES